MRKAQQHYKRTLLKKCMHSIRMYAIYRRKKKIQKLKLNEYAESQLVYRVYHTWVERYNQKKKINELDEQVDQFQKHFLLARVLEYWKSGKLKSNKNLLKMELNNYSHLSIPI